MIKVDYSCLIAAILLFSSNFLKLLEIAEEYQYHHTAFDFNRWRSLDPQYIATMWKTQRIPGRAISTSVNFINAAGWFFFAVPIMQVVWVLSHGGKRYLGFHAFIAFLAVAGSIMEASASLMVVGMDGALDWMAKDFNLDDWGSTGDGMGWKVLEMTHLAVKGLVLWIDAFEWVMLSIILTLIFASNATCEPKFFARRWSFLGLIIGSLCWLTFISDILRFVSWRFFMGVALVGSVMNSFILIPLWLVLLAFMLPRAKVNMYEDPATLALRRELRHEEERVRAEHAMKDELEEFDTDDADDTYDEEIIELSSIN
mmetsp:Transcript_1242/g.1601  ORF Transcript_1242/g.1601 Transcript_1242/m.1601 type:complete len:314 (-) Transcript_1242:119-1060(-)|eukprot:CAMPEP_0172514056 /NCGR_PEP_ID=MMETSP1066-20121228/257369_1 /TAXON_ID=671091 /ORGANISM="Coscinodiscus wailesii, Strain CCMP2513" /LENGTH=313 /DNA_ID=CAMNT_0013294577 /DNA_START=137 /DNA_END=1078 /DNA_ORIENTATION=-